MADTKIVTIKEIYEGYAKKSAENIAKGGKAVTIDVRHAEEVEIIKDFKGYKKGSTYKVGIVERDWLKANGAIK